MIRPTRGTIRPRPAVPASSRGRDREWPTRDNCDRQPEVDNTPGSRHLLTAAERVCCDTIPEKWAEITACPDTGADSSGRRNPLSRPDASERGATRRPAGWHSPVVAAGPAGRLADRVSISSSVRSDSSIRRPSELQSIDTSEPFPPIEDKLHPQDKTGQMLKKPEFWRAVGEFTPASTRLYCPEADG